MDVDARNLIDGLKDYDCWWAIRGVRWSSMMALTKSTLSLSELLGEQSAQ